MNGDILLDTNIVIAFMENEPAIQSRMAGRTVCISAVALGELYFGAQKSRLMTRNITRIEEFVRDVVVLGIDSETAQAYGLLRHRLRLKGRPIPENDLWIAATALQYSMKLISRDAHFKDVDNLDLEAW